MAGRSHAHGVRLPGGRRIRTEFDYLTEGELSGDMWDEEELEDCDDLADDQIDLYDEMDEDEETGFLGAIAGLASSVLGGLLGGKKKGKAKAAPAAAGGPVMQTGGGGDNTGAIISALQPAIRAAGIPASSPLRTVSPDQMRTLVKELLVTVPPPVRSQVTQALRDVQGQNMQTAAKLQKVAHQIDQKFRPQLAATMAALTLARDQRIASSEHKGIVRNESRWRKSLDADRKQKARLDEILAKLEGLGAHLEEKLGGDLAIVRGKRRIDILGGAKALNRAAKS